MSQFLLILAVALTVGAILFGITVLITGGGGLGAAEPDGRAVPLPADRPLTEPDVAESRFDTALRGYRMDQVDAALRRAAYDIGYKDELIKVLRAEVDALREERLPEAETLRRAREAALAPVTAATGAATVEVTAPLPRDPAASVDRGEEPDASSPPQEHADGPIAEEAGERQRT